MSALALKVIFTKSSQTKTLRFRSNMTVAEACRMIAQREGQGGPEYGLFQPKTSRNKARWLKQERMLDFYELRNDDKVEYKKRMRPLKVKLEDGTVKTVLIDDSDTVAGVVETIGKKMNLKNYEEFTLKYDNKDQWLTSGQSLTEQGLGERDMVQLKKRFFVNDANLDRSDPVQLHLVYAQSKNSILAGDHPLTVTECANLTALECQIVHGDYNPSLHKPGFLEKKFLPPQYHDRRAEVEKPLIAEYKKLVGMTEINAKFRYLSDVRRLKTYGITTFEVGQKVEGKKKPVIRRLGVTRDAILILDGETREILREFPLTHLRRWAASPKNFTLDFGDYEDDYLSLLTTDGEAISQLIGGYIDILLKKRKDAARVLDDDSALTASIGTVDGVRAGLTKGSMATRGRVGPGQDGAGAGNADAGHPLEYVKGPYGQQIKVTDLAQANRAMLQMLDEASPFGDFSKLDASARSNAEWRKQMMMESAACKKQSGELQKLLESPNGMDSALLNACASKMGEHVGALLNCARLASMSADGDPALLDSARLLAAAVAKMLKNANDFRGDPDSLEARMLYASAREEFDATQCMLNATCQGKMTDEADQRLLLAQAKAVAAATAELLRLAENSSQTVGDAALRKTLMGKAKRSDELGGQLLAVSRTLAPTIIDADCQAQLMVAGKSVKGGSGALLAAAKAAGLSGEQYRDLLQCAKSVSDAIAGLMKAAESAEARPRGDAQLQAAVNRLVLASQGLGEAAGNPRQIMERTKLLAQCQSRLMAMTKAKAQHMPEDQRQALLDAARALAAATQGLVDSAKVAAKNPKDPNAASALRSNAGDVEIKARQLGKVGNRGGQLQLLRANAKYATAATTELQAAVTPASARTNDPQMDDGLLRAAKASADAMARLLAAVYACNQNDPNAFNSLAQTAKDCVGEAFPLVATSKRAVPKIRDVGTKQNVQLTANEAQGAIKRLMDSTRVEKAVGAEDFDDAFATLSEDASVLEQAVLSSQQGSLRPQPGQSKEAAMAQLQTGARQLGGASIETAKAANTPALLGSKCKTAAETSSQVSQAARVLAANTEDRDTQLQLLQRAKAVNAASMDMLAAAQTVADDPQKENKVALAQAAKGNAAAVADLVRLAKSTETDGVDVALQELQAAMKNLNPRPPATGGDFKTPASQLVQAASGVEHAAKAMDQGAQLRDRRAVDAGARQLAQKLPLLVSAANAAASAAPEQQTRVAIVQHTRAALQKTGAMLQNAKRGAGADSSQLVSTLGQLSATCDVMTPDERQIAEALRQYDDAVANIGTGAAPAGGNYSQATQQLSAATKGLLQAMSRLQAASKAGQKGMPVAFTNVAKAMPTFVNAVAAAGAVAPPDAKAEFENAAYQIGSRGGDFMRQAKAVYEQPRSPAVQQSLASEYRNTATAVRALVTAIDKGATGAKAADQAISQIERLHQELTSGVFDVQLTPGATFESELAATAAAAPACANGARTFASLPVGDQAGMGSGANDCAAAAVAMAQHAKCAVRAADADDQQQAQQLTERAKALLVATRETLRAGKAYQANAANQRAADAMRNAAAGAAKHAGAIEALAAAAAAGPEVTEGERALSDAQARLREMLQQYRGGAYAGAPSVAENQEADEVIGTARQVAAEAGGIAAAADDSTLRDAAVSSVLAAEQLLQRTAAVLPTAADAAGQQRLEAASGAAIDALVQLCEAGKARARRNNAASQKGVNDATAVVGARVNDVVSAATDTLPKKASSIDTGENLEELAENELANCAREIERAAAMLMTKPARVRNAGLDAFDAVADAILDAAQNIAMATQQLVIVATKAQKEISANDKGGAKSVYLADPAWARGLISAAQAVAGNVKLLVTAANKAASNEGSEEELVACGRGVAAATIRLVTAARAKADPFSPTQRELQGAAKNVQVATEELVTHAKQYSDVTDVGEAEVDVDSMGAVAKMRHMREQEAALAALEAELAAEQNNLLAMQKARYDQAGK